MTTPKPRKDGVCLTPGCDNKVPERPEKAYATQAQFDANPFCSRPCAEIFYGVVPRQAKCPECGRPMLDPSAMKCDGCAHTAKIAVHGTVTSYDRGCRCDDCRGASNLQKKRWRDRNLEHQREWERGRKRKRRKRASQKTGPAARRSPSRRPPAENGERSGAAPSTGRKIA